MYSLLSFFPCFELRFPSISWKPYITNILELGHNWGATHDDMSVECSPPYSLGGSYVMNTFSVSGYDENNDVSFFWKIGKQVEVLRNSLKCFGTKHWKCFTKVEMELRFIHLSSPKSKKEFRDDREEDSEENYW